MSTPETPPIEEIRPKTPIPSVFFLPSHFISLSKALLSLPLAFSVKGWLSGALALPPPHNFRSISTYRSNFLALKCRSAISESLCKDLRSLQLVAANFRQVLCKRRSTTRKMKFLEYTPLDSINLFLNHLNLGDCTIKGSLDAFSCKQTGNDRKLSISLEHEILDYLGKSSDGDQASPVDHLACRTSRRTLIYLVLTLGHLYPDYDFSAVRAHLFFKEEEWDGFKETIDTYLSDASREWVANNGDSSLFESITKAIDEVITIKECEIYSYDPDTDSDPFLEKGAIWSFNFFFYNRKLKRVVSFCCVCTSNLGDGFLPKLLSDEDDDDDDDDDVLVDMDM